MPDNILRRGLLISLVADLIRDPKIRDDFNARPDEVVTRYGLPPDALATFYTMSRECMHSYITAQTKSWLDAFKCYVAGDDLRTYQYDEPGLGDDECDQLPDPTYPSPKPQIKQVRPKEHRVTQDLNLNIYGQSFPRNATVVLKKGATELSPVNKEVLGTFRTSRLHAVFSTSDLAPNPGDYDVKVLLKTPNCTVEITNWTCKLKLIP